MRVQALDLYKIIKGAYPWIVLDQQVFAEVRGGGAYCFFLYSYFYTFISLDWIFT